MSGVKKGSLKRSKETPRVSVQRRKEESLHTLDGFYLERSKTTKKKPHFLVIF